MPDTVSVLPLAMPRCRTALPVRLEIGDKPGHWAACWLTTSMLAPEPTSASNSELY